MDNKDNMNNMDNMDGEGEEYPYEDLALEKAFQKKRGKWLERNACLQSRGYQTRGQIQSSKNGEC